MKIKSLQIRHRIGYSLNITIQLMHFAMEKIKSNTILFITGAFVGHNIWDSWKHYFENKGFNVSVPCWPFKDAPPEVLRNRHPDSEIASLRLEKLLCFYEQQIKMLPEKPILIGHSLGGLMVQLLVQKDLAEAGIAIHSMPPFGVMTAKFSFLRLVFWPLGLFTSLRESYMMSFVEWQYAVTNGMSQQQQKDWYYEFAVPESKMLLRDTLTTMAKINFKKPHAPLLFISGNNDQLTPASLNNKNSRKYQHSGSVTEYKEFPGRNHFILGQVTWKEEAGFICDWIRKQST